MDDDSELRDQTVEDKAEDLELQDEAADQVGGGGGDYSASGGFKKAV